MKQAAIIAIALISAWIVGYFCGGARPSQPEIVETRDTVVVVDTVVVEKPVEVVRWKDRVVSVPLHTVDTVTVNDTVYIELPFERVEYAGDEYMATVSGFRPKLESVTVFPKTTYITNTEYVKKSWSFGITAGPGLLYDGKLHGGIGIVAGVQYNF